MKGRKLFVCSVALIQLDDENSSGFISVSMATLGVTWSLGTMKVC